MEQPNIETQRELDDIRRDASEIITIPFTRRKIKVGYIRRGTISRISRLLISKKEGEPFESTVTCKAAALIRLNGLWKIRLFYPFVWRWYAYVRKYNDIQLNAIIGCGKKKVTLEPYLINMMLLQGLNDTLQTMTRKEVQEQLHRVQ